MGGAEQVGVPSCQAGRETGEASGQEVGKCPTSMPPVVIADGLESQGAGRVYRSFTSDFPLGFGHQSLTRLLPRFREVALRLRPSLVGAGFHPAESIPDAMARDRLEHRV